LEKIHLGTLGFGLLPNPLAGLEPVPRIIPNRLLTPLRGISPRSFNACSPSVPIRFKPEPRSALSLALTEPAVTGWPEERSTLLRYCFASQVSRPPARSALFSCPRCHDSRRTDQQREPVARFSKTRFGSPQLNRHSLLGLRPSDQSTRSNVPSKSLPKQTTVTRSLPGIARLIRPCRYRITVPGSFRSLRFLRGWLQPTLNRDVVFKEELFRYPCLPKIPHIRQFH
jgi:hypothetical protein